MPRNIEITKDIILGAALDLLKESGIEKLNARALANKIGCSTQPIFRVYYSMEELKKELIIEANNVYNSYIEEAKLIGDVNHKYKQTGIAYIKLAKEEPHIFKLLFMRDREKEVVRKEIIDDNLEYILNKIMEKTGLTKEEAYDLHFQMWIYTHGLATMIVTKYIKLSDEEIDALLTKQFLLVKDGFLINKRK